MKISITLRIPRVTLYVGWRFYLASPLIASYPTNPTLTPTPSSYPRVRLRDRKSLTKIAGSDKGRRSKWVKGVMVGDPVGEDPEIEGRGWNRPKSTRGVRSVVKCGPRFVQGCDDVGRGKCPGQILHLKIAPSEVVLSVWGVFCDRSPRYYTKRLFIFLWPFPPFPSRPPAHKPPGRPPIDRRAEDVWPSSGSGSSLRLSKTIYSTTGTTCSRYASSPWTCASSSSLTRHPSPAPTRWTAPRLFTRLSS